MHCGTQNPSVALPLPKESILFLLPPTPSRHDTGGRHHQPPSAHPGRPQPQRPPAVPPPSTASRGRRGGHGRHAAPAVLHDDDPAAAAPGGRGGGEGRRGAAAAAGSAAQLRHGGPRRLPLRVPRRLQPAVPRFPPSPLRPVSIITAQPRTCLPSLIEAAGGRRRDSGSFCLRPRMQVPLPGAVPGGHPGVPPCPRDQAVPVRNRRLQGEEIRSIVFVFIAEHGHHFPKLPRSHLPFGHSLFVFVHLRIAMVVLVPIK